MKKLIFLLLLSQSTLADNTIAGWMLEPEQYEVRTEPYGMEIPERQEQKVIIWDSNKQQNCYYSGGIMFCSGNKL